jgi:D-alanyl-lipoteichoic acid acyltransferase DltB (MBOAT superfamily)
VRVRNATWLHDCLDPGSSRRPAGLDLSSAITCLIEAKMFISEPFILFAIGFGVVYFCLDAAGQRWALTIGCGFFYLTVGPLFLCVLAGSIIANYLFSGFIVNAARVRVALFAGIATNVAFLCVFKYFDFFSGPVTAGLEFFGIRYSPYIADVVLPLGISFYTLQAIGYLVDLSEKKLPRASFAELAAYLAFWPKFVAGPIIRAGRFMPQLRRRHRFKWPNFFIGLELIVYGLFLKTVLADYLAPQVDRVFANPAAFDAASTALAVLFFTVQIYGDFAGYSLMAIGMARILGFSVLPNFRRPMLARSFTDFWSRWHISLSTWLRDYVFQRLPLRPVRADDRSWASVMDIFAYFLPARPLSSGSTFRSLAGDSLAFVQVSLALEAYLGELPSAWDNLSIADLERAHPRSGAMMGVGHGA